jgi:AcrR family transcriptional regulator
MIDIARAADVSEQTLYNYFPTKENLILDRDQQLEERILDCVLKRAPGQSLSEAVRGAALNLLDVVSRSIGKPTGLPVSVLTSPALRRVWIEMNARFVDSVADALIRDSDGKLPGISARLLSRSIVAIFAVVLEELGIGVLAGKSRTTLMREIRPAIENAAELLQTGLERRSRPR